MEVVAHLAERRDTPKTLENPIVTRQKPIDQIQIEKLQWLRSTNSILGVNVVASAEKFLGLRYKWGGKTPKSGFDCSGFTSFVMQENGVNVQGASYHQSKLGKKSF